jgi:hypothetical protein
MDKEVYTSNPGRLVRTVELLSSNKPRMDAYTEHSLFKPYDINIKRCIPESRVDDAKRLFDCSFTTRQGGQTKEALRKYKQAEPAVYETLDNVLAILKGSRDARTKYILSLLMVHAIEGIEGIGQKIATMFLEFLIYYSDDFPGKDELLQELLIPFDAHVMKLLFTKVNGREMSGLNLYSEEVNQATLRYEFDMEGDRLEIKKNRLYTLHEHIREDFSSLKITKPPIILDHLWYVGTVYCTHSELSAIGCKICFLAEECETGKGLSDYVR